MDSLNHLIFAVLLVTPFGLSSYRLTAKIVLLYGGAVAVGYAFLGLSMNFIYLTDVVAYLIIFYILYLAWVRKRPFFKLFVLCLATVFIAGQSHGADRLFALIGQIPPMTSPIRPHNLWHTPAFGLILSAISAFLIPRFLNLAKGVIAKFREIDWANFDPSFVPLLAVTYLGYLIHVFADSITYDFDVWWMFPFSNIHFSLYDLADAGKLLATDPGNPWGWVYYYLTPALIIAAIVFVGLCYLARD